MHCIKWRKIGEAVENQAPPQQKNRARNAKMTKVCYYCGLTEISKNETFHYLHWLFVCCVDATIKASFLHFPFPFLSLQYLLLCETNSWYALGYLSTDKGDFTTFFQVQKTLKIMIQLVGISQTGLYFYTCTKMQAEPLIMVLIFGSKSSETASLFLQQREKKPGGSSSRSRTSKVGLLSRFIF